MLLFFVDHPRSSEYDLSSLKKLMFAGPPVTAVVFRKAIEQFGNIFIHGFGTTETMGSATILRTEEIAQALAERRTDILSSCGKSYTDMEAEVVDERGKPVLPGVIGEIRIRGKGMTLGYWNKAEETKRAFRDGWYYSGDLGKVDACGYIHIDGRKTEVIVTGGENVFPAEVENVLYRHPAVGQVAVIGVQDHKWGESVTAFVVSNPGAQVSEDELGAFCRKELAGYKVPKKFLWAEDLPTSASGKLLKNKLKEQYVQRQFQQAGSSFAKQSSAVPEDD
jgi:acyl-CoA synthetase (AMP-forming)/AMP-acid ligase II